MTQYEKRGYLLENFRLFHLNTDSETKVDFHYHEFCKLLLLVSGRGSYVVDGQRYLLQPGDAVLIGGDMMVAKGVGDLSVSLRFLEKWNGPDISDSVLDITSAL